MNCEQLIVNGSPVCGENCEIMDGFICIYGYFAIWLYVLDGVAQVAQDIVWGLAVDDLELETAVSILINYQLICFWQHTMFAALHPTQHFLVSANTEKADVQLVGFYWQIKGRMAGFRWVHVIAVAGDAAQLYLLERFV